MPRKTNAMQEDTMERFEGKVAGAAVTRRAPSPSREGGRVVVADIDGSAAIACTTQIAAEAGHALALTVDIAEAQAVAALFETADRHFGGVDLVNNASAIHLTPRDRAFLDLDLAVWDKTMAANLRGTLFCCRRAISRMIAGGGGAIVNMSSCQGLSGDTALTSYAASKAAMNMLSASLATQYGHAQIRWNAVAPNVCNGVCTGTSSCRALATPRTRPRWWRSCSPTMLRSSPPGRVHRRRHAGASADVRRRWQQPRRADCRDTARSGRGAALLMDMLLNPLNRRHRLGHDIPVVPGAFPLARHLPAICDLPRLLRRAERTLGSHFWLDFGLAGHLMTCVDPETPAAPRRLAASRGHLLSGTRT